MAFLSRLARFRHLGRDQRGNTLMMLGFALPFVVGAAGLGVHTMQLSVVKRQLQREADSAAMAGAYSLFQSKGTTAATAQANKALTQNPLVPGATATITPGSYTSGSTTYTSTMYVRLVSTQQTPLMALFGYSTSTVAAEARAAVVPDGKVCFLALESGTTTGVTFAGNSTLDLGCGVGTNSISANSAVNVNGQPIVKASPIVAMGGIPAATAYASGTVLMPNHSQLPNPFAGTSYDPVIDNNGKVDNLQCKTGNSFKTISVASGSSATGSPGCYGTIDVQGTLTLSPGTYYLVDSANNGGLQVGAQGHLICSGCTFVLTSNVSPINSNKFATMNINGGAEIDISAPDSGTYKGIAIYRDSRAAATNQCCTINGNANSTLSGAFYFPNDTLMFNGTQGMALNCFQMVALRLSFSGNSSITNTCDPPTGDPTAWKLDAVRLIS